MDMGDYRSRSHGGNPGGFRGHGGGQIQPYYSSSSASQGGLGQPPAYVDGPGAHYATYKNNGVSKSSSSNYWGFNDPEVKRKKRVASYKVYTVEGKVKGSFRKGFRWLKDKYTEIVYGWW